MEMILIALISALGAIMANKGIAVFNDGLRPIVPEHLEGRMTRGELAATSFAMSFGLVVGFGIPFSLTSSIILIHSIFLGTDIIGSFSPDGPRMCNCESRHSVTGRNSSWQRLPVNGIQSRGTRLCIKRFRHPGKCHATGRRSRN